MTYVLIAEDDADVAELLRQVLREHLDVATENVANGALVMDSLVARRPDLLILDIEMPGLRGLDEFALLRNDRQWLCETILFHTELPAKSTTAMPSDDNHYYLITQSD